MLNVPIRLIVTTLANEPSACGPSLPIVFSPIAMPAQFTRPWRPPKVLTASSTAALAVRFARHVALDEAGLRAELLRQRLAPVGLQVGDDDVGAARVQRPHRAFAEARRAAGDDERAGLQIHDLALPRFQIRSMIVAVAMPCPMHIVCEPERAAGRLEARQHLRHQPGAGGPERVAVRDRAAPRVELRGVGAELALPRERHAGEGLVHLDPVEVPDRHAGALERAPGRRDDAVELQRGIGADDDAREKARSWLQAVGAGRALVADEDGGGAVGDLARVAGGDHAAGLAEDGLERGHPSPGRPARVRLRPG